MATQGINNIYCTCQDEWEKPAVRVFRIAAQHVQDAPLPSSHLFSCPCSRCTSTQSELWKGISLSATKAAERITGTQDRNWLLVPNEAGLDYVNTSSLQVKDKQPITTTGCIHGITSAILRGTKTKRGRERKGDGKRQRKFVGNTGPCLNMLTKCWR